MRSLRGVGQEIRRARGRRPQKAIASRAAISLSALSRLESGQRKEGLELLLRVLDAVGLEMTFVARRPGLAGANPEVAVEEALAADPQLREHTREVILAAYRRARHEEPGARPKGRAV